MGISTDNMLALVLAIIGAAAASSNYQYKGRYAGKCGNDGIYYRDSASFVICSNGNSYVQPCAPGSRNAAIESYGKGYTDFCGVNLVDNGYGAKKYSAKEHGYGYDAPSYGRPSYGYEAPSYGYGRDAYRPDQHRNQNGYATRAAYNDGYGYAAPAYGGHAYGGYGYGAPRYQAPRYEAPRYEAPKYEAPRYDAPRSGGEHKVEVRKEVRSYSTDNKH